MGVESILNNQSGALNSLTALLNQRRLIIAITLIIYHALNHHVQANEQFPMISLTCAQLQTQSMKSEIKTHKNAAELSRAPFLTFGHKQSLF